jgi:hypothetical protein
MPEGTSVLTKFALPRIGLLAVVAVAAELAAAPAQAQGRLDARYTATLAGVQIGRGTWVIDINGEQFSAIASGMTAGLLRVFSSGRGTGASRGVVRDGVLFSTAYASKLVAGKSTDDVQMTLDRGTVKEYAAEPPISPHPDRIPVKDIHLKDILDPMTASLIRVPGNNGNTFVPAACDRTLPVFDGRMRFDVELKFKRLDTVKSDKGYQGTVVVCAVQFRPVAGHVPDRATIKYLVEQKDIELWLAPIARTRVMAPYRISSPTPLGTGIVQATQFVTVAHPPQAVPSTARTQ